MQLSYRGRAYTASSPAIETVDTPQVGQYLGQPFPIQHSRSVQPQSSVTLRYRGTDYTA